MLDDSPMEAIYAYTRLLRHALHSIPRTTSCCSYFIWGWCIAWRQEANTCSRFDSARCPTWAKPHDRQTNSRNVAKEGICRRDRSHTNPRTQPRRVHSVDKQAQQQQFITKSSSPPICDKTAISSAFDDSVRAANKKTRKAECIYWWCGVSKRHIKVEMLAENNIPRTCMYRKCGLHI